MERRDKLLLWLLLAAAGYGGYTNWDVISTRLGLADLGSRNAKAIGLAKGARTLDPSRTNGAVVAALLRSGEAELAGEPWLADRVDGDRYVVACRYTLRGQPQRHRFEVDVETGAVTPIEETGQPPR